MPPPKTDAPTADIAPDPELPRWMQVQAAGKLLNEAASASRLVGGVFVALGVFLVYTALDRRMYRGMQVLAVANAVVLVGPGSWYILAAAFLRRLERRAATVAIRVAAVQGVLVVVGLVLAGVIDSRGTWSGLYRPALLAIFFMPALGALVFHLRRARAAMNLLGGGESGFEALAPRPVIPLEPPDLPADDAGGVTGGDSEGKPPPVQGSDSLRAK